jgi:quercetin dioxygenase-like cupin family protein
MTTPSRGYALASGEALEQMDMGGDVLRLLVGVEQSDGSISVIGGLIYGGGPPLHVHDDEDEVVVVLDGELSYRVGEQRGTVSTGGLLWFPRMVPHTIANLSNRPCRFLTVATPGGIEQLFRAQSEYLASLAPGTSPDAAEMERLPGAASRRVVGPPLGREEI